MSKKKNSNSILIDDYKNDQKEDYMNIAKQNEEYIKTKKFEKFKPKNSTIGVINLLKEEENKLKTLIFSIIKKNENQSNKIGSNSNITISNENDDQINNPPNKNNKQLKKNTKKLKIKIRHKIIKSKSEIKRSKFSPKNNNSNLYISPQNNVKKTFSFEMPKFKKELKNINLSISSNKKSRNNNSSLSKSRKNSNSDDNQNSIKCLNISSKNSSDKFPDKLTNKKEEKNCINIKNKNEEKNKDNIRRFSEKNKKCLMEENLNFSACNNKINTVSASPINTKNSKNSKINFSKSEKNINKLKISNMKILKINKQNIKKNIIIRPDDKKTESQKLKSSCVSNCINRPKISGSIVLPTEKFSSQGESFENIKSLSKIDKNKKNKKGININKPTKNMIKINENFRKLIRKELVYDSLDDDESEFEETVSNNFYIDPNSNFCFIFDLIIFFLTAYTSIAIPYFLAKNIRECKDLYFSFFHLLNCLSEIFNTMDTILGFFRAYYNYDELLIKKSKLMIINYISSWFLFDLISSIPFYTIFNSYQPECTGMIFNKYYDYEMHNLHYLFLCTKMIKLLKVFKNNRGFKIICKILQKSLFIKDAGSLIGKTYIILLIFHFGACVHIFIGRNSYPNWIINVKMETSGFSEIYLTAIYCLTMTITSVGYGDITCYSFNERIYQIILLIFGIMAYSWIVSSISNIIKEYSNNSNDYKEKIDMLNDIKLHHPNMSNKLYNRISQYLKYRNRNVNQNKNLIFDCLPLSLKNNLIFEMYKPIITKFIFFKNIDNIDFIVKVVLAFRPVMAVKNDIMVNDGDMVEEIVFVKKGVLIVQLLVNLKNYKENVRRYSTINLFNLKNKTNLEKSLDFSILSDKTLNNTSIIDRIASYEKKYKLNNNSFNENILNYKTKSSSDDKNSKYIKIINIRENEHFGDVLMFSEQRSPMRVMVRSTKAELFLLKKEDVVKISFAYSNIWRRINEKSVYNFEQMKKSIQKIMEVLSPQTLQSTIFYENNENRNDESLINKKIENKKKDIECVEEKSKFFKSKNNEVNDSKNIIGNTKSDSMFSNSVINESVENNDIEKENKKNNTDMKKKENINKKNKTENSLILSTKYSYINSDDKKFYSEGNKKLTTKVNIFNKTNNQSQKVFKNKKNKCSTKSLENKNTHNFILNTNSTINNDIHTRNNRRSLTTTPYRKEEVNQEIYANEKFELPDVDGSYDNLFSKKKFFDNLIINKNNINSMNSKSKIKTDYIVDKLNDINIINNVNNKNNNIIISKEDYFSIESSYENFNSLSKNTLINDDNLQKKMKTFLRKNIIRSKLSRSVIKTKNLNLDFIKINDENSINNNKKNKLSINNKSSVKSLNNISYDSKNENKNNISVNGIPLNKYNNITKNSNKNLQKENSIKITPDKSKSHLNLNRVYLGRKLSVNPSFHPLYKLKRNNSFKNMNKSFDKGNSKSTKCNNLLSLINNNIMASTRNLIEPDKFYRYYFNNLINNKKHNNNQKNFEKEKHHQSLKPKNDLSNFSEERKNLFQRVGDKRNKSFCNKKNI